MGRVERVVIALAGGLFAQGAAAFITLHHAQISDVTPSSFAVVWYASSASQPSVSVFADAAGTQDITAEVEVVRFPLQGVSGGAMTAYERDQARRALQQTARQKGMNKVLVRGLAPDTAYYVRATAVGASDSGQWPATGTQAVTTQRENGFITDSALVVVDLHDSDPRGWLVMASLDEATHPVSSFVEAGAGPGQAVLNLANLFGSDGVNWAGLSATTLTVQIIKGDGEVATETLELVPSNRFAVATALPLPFGGGFDGTIEMVAPAAHVYSRGDGITLAWVDEATEINATVALYMDTDGSGEDGVLIADGLAEDPDGSDDEYTWDVSGVAEGSYYVYAVLSDGSHTIAAYSPARITIDHTQTDGDGDQLSDLWEQHYFETLARDGTGDVDGDGISDELEQFYGVDPLVSNAAQPELTLDLAAGSHLVGVPGLLVPRLSSRALLEQLGAAVQSIGRYNPANQQLETTFWDEGVAAGAEFDLLPGQGYVVEMLQDGQIVWSPFDSPRPVAVMPGLSLIAVTEERGEDAFGWLERLGEGMISSIRRRDPRTSLYETAAFDAATPVGQAFPLQLGEGYIISVKQQGTIE